MAASLVYRRHGGSLQVDIPHFDALVEAVRIPETQWIATACPIEGLHCDPRFLALLDRDGNRRIRVAELRAAVDYTAKFLQSRKGADAKSDVLELEALSAEGAPLKAAALRVLGVLKSSDMGRISLEQVLASAPVLRKAGVNGDGIVEPAFLPEAVRPLATRIMASFPEVKNRAEQPGIDVAMLHRFRMERAAFLAHQGTKNAVHVWGEASLGHAQRIREVKPLLDAYFLQCRLVAAQPDAAASLKLPVSRVEGVLGDTAALEKAAALLPIAGANPAGVLTWSRLFRGPAFEVLDAFRKEVVFPTLGEAETLSDAEWRKLSAQADAVLAWQAAFDASPVRAMLSELPSLAEADLDTIEAASKADLALKEELDAITELERLILYQRWLLTFANNFISMPDLYTAKRHALYEQGTLILGGRKYTLAVLVRAHDEHAALTTQGTTCILYVKVVPKDGAVGYEVAVPVTRGRSTHLEVGKRGIFHDVQGQEHDAIVTQVVRQPVSLWEAMTMPFQRIGRFITSKVEALAASGDKAFDEQLEKGYAHTVQAGAAVAAAPTAPAAPAASAPAAGTPGGLGGLVVAGGIAFAALGSALAFIVSQVRSLSLGDVFSAVIIIASIVMLPSGLLGWLKLRNRNLALLLEGSGWALNDRLMLTRELATLITRKPRLPQGATIDHADHLRSSLERIRGEEDEKDTEAEVPGSVKLLVVLFIFFALLWQFRAPMARLACGRGWLSGTTCDAVLPSVEEPSATQRVAPPAP
ncbi:kinesin [Stigmatella sp. ncwal1]|uniref:Kinesin n=1 Tax=Stigmatella ashevillensis TaxID=2995309 RepID=A0ABT5DG20_9BACT|nr:kinesin [Stigmatella ashevillena]MDC0712461.1 kinesin [Stigmatella ashevillena]